MQGIGSRSVPELPAEERDSYIRQVSSTVGLAALAATVVRVAPGLLWSLCSPSAVKSEPILAELGKLEQHILLQLAVAETWKRNNDASNAIKGITHSMLLSQFVLCHIFTSAITTRTRHLQMSDVLLHVHCAHRSGQNQHTNCSKAVKCQKLLLAE